MTHQIYMERRGEREVKRFAEAMIEKLNEPKNLEKGNWVNCSFAHLQKRLLEEIKELEDVIEKWWDDDASEEEVLKECADVANFAMMIADKVGALE